MPGAWLDNPPALIRALDRLDSEESLAGFVRRAWPVIEPGAPYIHGWHIDAVCAHLEAVTAGEITRLLINVPPGTMKSLLAGVFWPAWEWGPKNRPSLRTVAVSHTERLALRDNLRTRRLITSPWYRDLWGGRVRLTRDQNRKGRFETTATGLREAVSAGSITGSRGDRVILDDPISVDGVHGNLQPSQSLTYHIGHARKQQFVSRSRLSHSQGPNTLWRRSGDGTGNGRFRYAGLGKGPLVAHSFRSQRLKLGHDRWRSKPTEVSWRHRQPTSPSSHSQT
ncbi:hypothetical protein [Methylobacterium currus]|uniref:hypothetical protein n=1 Tax=Methylobacterium currus TaxID=2051553 RepID=UPI001FD338E0|nr:hypothetical protein [Methylobacterium currus]